MRLIMKKVFCKDCVHLDSSSFPYLCKSNPDYTYDYFKEFPNFRKWYIKNKLNNCTEFKSKKSFIQKIYERILVLFYWAC